MKSSKNAQAKTMPEWAGKGRQGVGGNGNLRPVRDGNERSRGRKAGVPNKTTRILKETILQAAEELGELERRTAVIKSENAPVRKVRGRPFREIPAGHSDLRTKSLNSNS
jgi:hypothetical protein